MSDPATKETPPATLLCVDDEANILNALRRVFRPHGYRVLVAESGAAGLKSLEAEAVDLVISDMRMPEMDGAQFLEQVRQRWPDAIRILLTGYADIESTIGAINRGEIYRYLTKPWQDDDIVLIVRDALARKRLARENARLLALTQSQNEELQVLNAGLEQTVASRTEEIRQIFNQLEQSHRDLKRSFLTAVQVFSGLIELRGGSLSGHSRRVAEHARAVAQSMDLDDGLRQDIFVAALLHDIGKIGLPDRLLGCAFNTLSADARAKVMKHPVTGEQVLLGVDQLAKAAKLIRHHHEQYDGKGYPDGLVGLAIPIGARILAVANEFDNLLYGTLTQQTMRPPEALAWMVANRGKRYDPEVIDVFARLIGNQVKDVVLDVPTRPSLLRPGMVVTRDLMHPDGYLLLTKGYVLSTVVIEQLKKLETVEHLTLAPHIREEAKR